MQTLACLSLTPGPDTIPKALAWLESVAEQERWPQRMAFKLGLCLDEALSNIVMYGFKELGDASQPCITLAILVNEQHITLDIVDNGIPFDPTQATPRDLAESVEEAHIGGHGLRLMRHYLQNIQYQRADEQNHLRLTAVADLGGS